MRKVIFVFFLGAIFTFSYQQRAHSQSPAIEIILGIINHLGGDNCITGGENASRCSFTVKAGAGVNIVGSGGSGDVSVSYSIACREGSYACCNIEGAKCVSD